MQRQHHHLSSFEIKICALALIVIVGLLIGAVKDAERKKATVQPFHFSEPKEAKIPGVEVRIHQATDTTTNRR